MEGCPQDIEKRMILALKMQTVVLLDSDIRPATCYGNKCIRTVTLENNWTFDDRLHKQYLTTIWLC